MKRSQPQKKSVKWSKRLSWRLADWAVQFFIGLLSFVPYRQRILLSGWAVCHVAAPLLSWKKRARANLALAMPELEEAEIKHIAENSFKSIGRTVMELYSNTGFADRTANAEISGDGLEALLNLKDTKKPAIVISAHFANPNAVRDWLTQNDYKTAYVYRPLANPYINAHHVKNLSKGNTVAFANTRRDLGKMMRHVKKDKALFILPDHHMYSGKKLLFFGKEAMTGLSAAKIALERGTPLIPAFAIRQPDGISFKIEFSAAIPPTTPQEMMQTYNNTLEALVRKYPEQWFWVHRRWKS